MSPISETATGLDVMQRMAIPAIVVGGAYLGAISHNLTAVEAMRGRGLQPLALILSQGLECDSRTLVQTRMSLLRLLTIPVILAPRQEGSPWGALALKSLLARSDLLGGAAAG